MKGKYKTFKDIADIGIGNYKVFLEKERAKFLETLPEKIKKKLKRAGIEIIKTVNITHGETKWSDYSFHLKYRIHLNRFSTDDDFEAFFNLLPQLKDRKEKLRQIIKEGVRTDGVRRFYDLSILPLNYLLGEPTINYFIPPKDYLDPHPTKKDDPYGLIKGRSRVKGFENKPAVVVNLDSKQVLGTHKFTHTFLYNIDFYCPVGCSDCYKTRMGTREYVSEGVSEIFRHDTLGELKPPKSAFLKEMTKNLVEWMNNDTRGQYIYDVIISGGEPLLIPNKSLKVVLDEFSKAKYLKILRICTATIFLGLPFRIDDEFVNILKDFSHSTGVRVTIQAHLGNHHMITPEAVYAVDKLKQAGINIYSQIPIKNGINFFLDDLDKTMDYLVKLGRMQTIIGVEPYMFIVDMHPSTNAYYVPIEPLMQVWGRLVESHDYPGLERPRTLSVLFEGGNIILSGHILFSAYKEVDKYNKRVIYYIPRVGPTSDWKGDIEEIFVYEEPLIKGINDDPKSLERIKRKFQGLIIKNDII